MPWFRLDDSFHSHPKVIAAGNEAIGLYVRCGTYAAQHLTDGFIPDAVVLLYGKPALADTLVRTKLWRRARGGYRMPDYLDYNPSRRAVDNERKNAAERQRRHRTYRTVASESQSVDNSTENAAEGKDPTSQGITSRRDSRRDSRVSHTTPSRPVPDPLVDVVGSRTGSNGRAPEDELTIKTIIETIRAVTGRKVDDAWAAKIAAHILSGRKPKDRAAYCRKAIEADPDPRTRFLPVGGTA